MSISLLLLWDLCKYNDALFGYKKTLVNHLFK